MFIHWSLVLLKFHLSRMTPAEHQQHKSHLHCLKALTVGTCHVDKDHAIRVNQDPMEYQCCCTSDKQLIPNGDGKAIRPIRFHAKMNIAQHMIAASNMGIAAVYDLLQDRLKSSCSQLQATAAAVASSSGTLATI